MAEKTDTLAAISSRKCKGTGIGPELARTLFDNPGKHVLAIVELGVGDRVIKTDGQQVVQLTITTIEPVIAKGRIGQQLDNHARELQQALYRQRLTNEGQEELPMDDDGGPAPRPLDVIEQGKALLEKGADGNPTGIAEQGDNVTPIDKPAASRKR